MTTNEVAVPLIVCAFCTKEDIQRCKKCDRPFCIDHTSRFSPNFCQDCLHISVTRDKFVRTVEEYDHTKDEMVVKRDSCDRIRLDGPDYVFYTKWINNLNDDELKGVFEFHYFIVKLIEHENEVRVINRNKKTRESPHPISIMKTTETRSIKQTKTKDMRADLRKLGLSDAVIELMIKAAQGG